MAEAEFEVSMQPGDNFRVVAACDASYFNGLSAEQDDGSSARVIKDGTNAVPSNRITDLLTVWRRLHVEVDSMAAVTNNFVTNFITGIIGSPTVATQLTLGINLRTGLSPQDNSANLSTSTSRGRFQNGVIRIGTGASQVVQGNGDNFVRQPSGFIIPAQIISGTNTVNAGRIIGLSGNVFTIAVNLGTNSYAGGTLVVVGTTNTITSNTSNTVTVSGTAQIPFWLHDDDDDTLLPRGGLLNILEAALFEAYITALSDEGGTSGNNQNNAVFRANLPGTSKAADEASFQRQSAGADDFWVAYLLASYQYAPNTDQDPNNEPGTGGVCWAVTSNTSVVKGGDGTQVFSETIRDRLALGSLAGLELRVTAHEIGHQLGLDHWDTGEIGVLSGAVADNLMLRSMQNVPNSSAKFANQHLHLIRSRQKSPGH